MFLLASCCVSFVFFQAESTFPLHVLASGYDSATYGYLILGPGLGTRIFQWSPAALWVLCGALGIVAAALVLEVRKGPAAERA